MWMYGPPGRNFLLEDKTPNGGIACREDECSLPRHPDHYPHMTAEIHPERRLITAMWWTGGQVWNIAFRPERPGGFHRNEVFAADSWDLLCAARYPDGAWVGCTMKPHPMGFPHVAGGSSGQLLALWWESEATGTGFSGQLMSF